MIYRSERYSVFKDKVVQDRFFAQAFSGKELISNYRNPEGDYSKTLNWKLSKDVSEHPRYESAFPLLEALYHMSLEEMEENMEPDNTFRTGAEWVGVWTRDISYSIMLSLAVVHPEICKTSLRRKVKNKRIVQDTGTGGAYPVSTDRVVWGVAAWEIYLVTGDRDWLEEAYEILKLSIEDDLRNVFNSENGLYKGESSFLDWREQSYPQWMQPADIYESECLGTNAVHYQALHVLATMASILEDEPASVKFAQKAQKLKAAINQHLWMAEKNYYGQYLYGRTYKILSPRTDALGEALCVLFGIAEHPDKVVAATPVNVFGIPAIYPQIPDVPSYHNNGVWPFVQAFWTMAAAKVKNEKAVLESISALVRAAALFLTNKENFEADTGDDEGTVFNSDRQLWSVAGALGMYYKVLFGIELNPDKVAFHPVVPEGLQGTHRLSNFKWRDVVLDIEVTGFGSKIKEFLLDGKPVEHAQIPEELKGHHHVKMILDSVEGADAQINKAQDYFSPPAPKVSYSEELLRWDGNEKAVYYKILRNGKVIDRIETNEFAVSDKNYAQYQVIALDNQGVESFASEPLSTSIDSTQKIVEADAQLPRADHPFEGYSGRGFIETNTKKNTSIRFDVEVEEKGLYVLDFRYSNGNGPVNTDNKCAIRTLRKDDQIVGTMVFPQRGTNEWSNWGFSNSVKIWLDEGLHVFNLNLEKENENMNGEINECMIDGMRVVRVGE
jgi:hypothetical protein